MERVLLRKPSGYRLSPRDFLPGNLQGVFQHPASVACAHSHEVAAWSKVTYPTRSGQGLSANPLTSIHSPCPQFHFWDRL